MALQEYSAPQDSAPQHTEQQDAEQEINDEDGGLVPPDQPTAELATVDPAAEADAPPLGDWDWQAGDAADARRRHWRAAVTLIVMALISLAGLAGGLWLFFTS